MSERALNRRPASRLGARLYEALPAATRLLDEPTLDDRGQGALRRLTDVLGVALDAVLEGTEALRGRHDLDRMPVARLRDIARWIGWTLDLDQADPERWRAELRRAPEIFANLGTEAGLGAIVRRATGWEVRWRRMADQVAFTWSAGERPLGSRTVDTRDGAALATLGAWDDPIPRTFSRGVFDAATVEGWLYGCDSDGPALRRQLAELDRLIANFKPLHVTIRWVPVRETPTVEEPLHGEPRLLDDDPNAPEHRP